MFSNDLFELLKLYFFQDWLFLKNIQTNYIYMLTIILDINTCKSVFICRYTNIACVSGIRAAHPCTLP